MQKAQQPVGRRSGHSSLLCLFATSFALPHCGAAGGDVVVRLFRQPHIPARVRSRAARARCSTSDVCGRGGSDSRGGHLGGVSGGSDRHGGGVGRGGEAGLRSRVGNTSAGGWVHGARRGARCGRLGNRAAGDRRRPTPTVPNEQPRISSLGCMWE
eukprot:6154112-Prymnesium_polylepis.1